MLVLPKILHTTSFKYSHAHCDLIIAFGSPCIQCCGVQYQQKGQKGQKSVRKLSISWCTSNGDDSINSSNSGKGSRRVASRAPGMFIYILHQFFMTEDLTYGYHHNPTISMWRCHVNEIVCGHHYSLVVSASDDDNDEWGIGINGSICTWWRILFFWHDKLTMAVY